MLDQKSFLALLQSTIESRNAGSHGSRGSSYCASIISEIYKDLTERDGSSDAIRIQRIYRLALRPRFPDLMAITV